MQHTCNTLHLTLQHTATPCNTLQHTVTHCNTLQHTATHCNTLQHTAAHCNLLQCTTMHCNTLQHTATHCNTLQHTATHCNTATQATACGQECHCWRLPVTTHCKTLQHTAIHCNLRCNTLYHTATHCNTLQLTLQHTIPHRQQPVGGSATAHVCRCQNGSACCGGHEQVHTYTYTHVCIHILILLRIWKFYGGLYTWKEPHMWRLPVSKGQRVLRRAWLGIGWLWLVGSLQLYVSFAEEPYKRDDILQKKPIILRSLLIVAILYIHTQTHMHVYIYWYVWR